MPKVRIGIDVGGTFTHAVALDNETYQIIGSVMVPTTHKAPTGVAEGIVESLFKLLKESNISASDVSFIAHSTTQATNALLEGDVAKVGIIGMGCGVEGIRAKGETKIEDLYHRFYDTSNGIDNDKIKKLVQELIAQGAQSIVAAEAFSVDNPENEIKVMELTNLPGCGTHEISGLYGLKMRTRTAVINASILPKMLEAASMTDKSVKESGITSPLMVMRNDGGVINIDEVKKRPILTILSGPAAGVAAALMYVKISDGIFIEVGGTSTDISAIADGRSAIKSAQVGGRNLFLKTLDVRTVGVAGGSLPKVERGKIVDIGPRSAHILGLPYVCFSNPNEIVEPQLAELNGYTVIQSKNGRKYAFTTTCAKRLGKFGPFTEKMAEDMLELASNKIIRVVENFIKEYKFDRQNITLVGGGGGAGVLVPIVSQNTKIEYKIAENAPVISAIGAALALVSETVERSIVNPSDEDILKIRQEAEAKVVKMGAKPDTVEIQIEVDKHKNIIRIHARGSTEIRKRDLTAKELSHDQRQAIAMKSLRSGNVKLIASTGKLDVFSAAFVKKEFFGLIKTNICQIKVIDIEGIIRLQKQNAAVIETTRANAVPDFKSYIEKNTNYGDAGMVLPEVFLLYRDRISNLSNLTSVEQMISIAELEIRNLAPDQKIVILTSSRY